MPPAAIPRQPISTERLTLRPTEIGDAARAVEIQSDWAVTGMLRMAPFPPDPTAIRDWFAGHAGEWVRGTAYRFAIEHRGRLIGVTDIDEIEDQAAGNRIGDLGYWLEQASWGQGFAFEAAQAVVRFAFNRAGLRQLRSGHALDNPASGKVLLKLGFQPQGRTLRHSAARGGEVMNQLYLLTRLDN